MNPDATNQTTSLNLAFEAIRALEEANAPELRTLFGEHGEDAIEKIFLERGGRQLSNRSRHFWALVFGLQAPSPHPAAESLWLL